MRPDSLARLWRYINPLLTYLLTPVSNRPDRAVYPNDSRLIFAVVY